MLCKFFNDVPLFCTCEDDKVTAYIASTVIVGLVLGFSTASMDKARDLGAFDRG